MNNHHSPRFFGYALEAHSPVFYVIVMAFARAIQPGPFVDGPFGPGRSAWVIRPGRTQVRAAAAERNRVRNMVF
jgi:hypothetical protein